MEDINTNHIEVKSLLLRFLRNWYWFILFGISAFAGGYAYLRYEIPIFSVSAKILVKEDDKSDMIGQNNARFSRAFMSRHYFLTNQIEILKSNRLMEDVVEKLELNIRYFTLGRVKTSEAYNYHPIKIEFIDSMKYFINSSFNVKEIDENTFNLVINSNDTTITSYGKELDYGGYKFKINRFYKPEPNLTISIQSTAALAGMFTSRLRITPVKQSEVLNISLNDPLTERATDVLSVLIDAYNEAELVNKNASTIKTVKFIDERLSIISDELFDVEKELELFKQKNNVPIEIRQSAQQFIEKVSASDESIVELELEEGYLVSLNKILVDDHAEYDFLPIDASFGDDRMSHVSDYNELVKQRKLLLISANVQNPSVIAINDQLEDIKKNILNWIVLKQAELTRRKKFIEERSSPMNERIASIPQFEREFLQIVREQKIKETIFNFLLQRREESGMSLASEVTNTRIIDYPAVNGLIYPNRVRIYVIFLFLGLSIPTIILVLVEYFDNKVYSQGDIEKYTKTPFLGSIILGNESEKLVVKDNLRSVTAETFRQLRSNLNYLAQTSENKSILITSSMSAEGKTFISLNLAASIALSGKSVIVVGMDLRKPKLSTYLLGQNVTKGVSNFITDKKVNLDDLIVSVEDIENLYVLDSGPVPPNPAELLLNDRTKEMFELLAKKYDHIIIDSAPVGLVADAFSFKDMVDCAIYVAKFAYTKKAQMGIIEEIYESNKLPNIGIVLNGVKKGSGYGYNRYGYSYSYYEHNDTWYEKLRHKFNF